MSEQFQLDEADFGRILRNEPGAIHAAMRTLHAGLNEAFTRIDRRRLLWQSVPYASGLFSASAGTWTVASSDLTSYRYVLADRVLIAAFQIENSTTSGGMGTDLYLMTPRNVSAQSASDTGFCITAGNTTEVAQLSTRSGSDATSFALTRVDGSSWPSSVTDDLDIRGMIVVEI
tara:strand:+ start:2386 stop:2907 length:522 start_codon:yes stop_codon:yes gene_type:complete